jgi:Protein of unknown function (DUF2510)
VADVFNSLSSLIWLVIVLLIIAAVVAVVKVLFAPRGEPYIAPRVVEQPVAQQPVPASGLAPGWYPDQNDQTLMRFFDGQVWTSRTQPRN